MQNFEPSDDLIGLTPEEIAQKIFIKNPLPPNSCRIISDEESQDLIYIFQILITIFMTGLNILCNGLDKIDTENLTVDHLISLNDWYKSLGFNIKAYMYDIEEKEMYEEYYCKIILKNKANETYFIMRQLEKHIYNLMPVKLNNDENENHNLEIESLEDLTLSNWHCLINGKFLEQNQQKKYLKDLYAIFLTNTKVFKIKFDVNML